MLLYSGLGAGADFLAVELWGGHLRFVYDVGSGPRSVHPRAPPYPLNDLRWHNVSTTRKTPQIVRLVALILIYSLAAMLT